VASQEAGRRLESAAPPAILLVEAPPKRIGSGAVSIEGVRLLDAAGQPAGRVVSGEGAALEMVVKAGRPIADFVFGFAINTVSGAAVFGSNTSIDGFEKGELSGEARVCLDLPACALGAGLYSIDAAVHARDGSPYDYRRDVLRFEVTAERAAAGVWNPLHEWRFSGGVRWKA
jgi:hypothetical protein